MPVSNANLDKLRSNIEAAISACLNTSGGMSEQLLNLMEWYTALNGASSSGSVLARSMKRKWRDDFPDNTLSANWQVVQTGSGHSIQVASSELQINTGTTPNTETIIRSVSSFEVPLRLFGICWLTQRIANQEFYLELVDASGKHYAQWLFDGTSNTTAKCLTANNNNFIAANVSSINATSSWFVYEIELNPEEAVLYQRNSDNAGTRGASTVRNRQIPDPELTYFVQIRAKNLATAPASTTSFRFDSIAVQEHEELITEVVGGRASGAGSSSIPITVTNTPSVVDNTSFNTEFSVALAASASATGGPRDCNGRNLVRGFIFSDQSGTMSVDQSLDGSTWRKLLLFL